MAHCRSCFAPIRWVKRPGKRPHEKGAFVALDPEPSNVGIYLIVDDRLHLADIGTPKDAPRFTPHSAMCSASGVSLKRMEATP